MSLKSFAIVIVCYKRVDGIKRLVKQLEQVDFNSRKDITLIFSIDKSDSLDVINYASEYKWPHGKKEIRTFEKRQGLKNHILSCGNYTKDYDIITILEDDIYVSNSLYNYAYNAACFYWNDTNIAGISLYNFQKNWIRWIYRFEPQKSEFDTYFLKIAQSWGQVWTKNKWEPFVKWYEQNKEFNKSNSIPYVLNEWPESSWLKYHTRYCIENDKYFVYPYTSISTNYSDPGEHANFSINDHQVELMYDKSNYIFSKFESNSIIYDEYMEREHLDKYLDVPKDELMISLWGTKQLNYFSKRYILTTKILPYKIIKSYSLSLRPIELSIIKNNEGDGIYLYDTSIKTKKIKRDSEYELLLYSTRTHDYGILFIFAIKMFYKEIFRRAKLKIKKQLKVK